MSERAKLDTLAKTSHYDFGPMGTTLDHLVTIFDRYWKGTSCLELGPAEGLMTGHLVGRFSQVTAVEGAAELSNELRSRFPTVTVVNSLFEEFEPGIDFDTIVLGHVLEHVESPVELLMRVASWLAPAGVICAGVPNARSLHRQLGVLMGLLEHEHQLNETDIAVGHRRVYDTESLRLDFADAGLRVVADGGYLMKMTSNAQYVSAPEIFSAEYLQSSMILGEMFPNIAAELYLVADAGPLR